MGGGSGNGSIVGVRVRCFVVINALLNIDRPGCWLGKAAANLHAAIVCHSVYRSVASVFGASDQHVRVLVVGKIVDAGVHVV